MRLTDCHQLLGVRAEYFRLTLRDNHEVLDSHAAAPLEVDAGLTGDDVAWLEHVLGLRSRHRRLVHEQADAVAEPVPELLAEASVLDHAPCRRVGVSARYGRTHRIQSGKLAPQARVVRLGKVARKLAGRERACAVRVVTLEHRAGVDDDRRVRLYDAVGGPAVGRAPAGPGADDALEGCPVCAKLTEDLLQPPGKVAVGASDEALLCERGIGLVRD